MASVPTLKNSIYMLWQAGNRYVEATLFIDFSTHYLEKASETLRVENTATAWQGENYCLCTPVDLSNL